jgi:hypothetical protein
MDGLCLARNTNTFFSENSKVSGGAMKIETLHRPRMLGIVLSRLHNVTRPRLQVFFSDSFSS